MLLDIHKYVIGHILDIYVIGHTQSVETDLLNKNKFYSFVQK